MVIAKVQSHQAYGNTILAQSPSHSVLMTLASKYVGREHVKHLSGILNKHYKCSQDWDGARYLGVNIDWDYINKNIHVSMLNYVPEALI
jgi:hypothetical protein